MKNSEAWSSIPVVLCSGDPRARSRILGRPDVLYVEKPLELDALLSIIEKAIAS